MMNSMYFWKGKKRSYTKNAYDAVKNKNRKRICGCKKIYFEHIVLKFDWTYPKFRKIFLKKFQNLLKILHERILKIILIFSTFVPSKSYLEFSLIIIFFRIT